MDSIKYTIIKGTIDQYALFEECLSTGGSDLDIQSKVDFNFNSQYRILKCTTSITIWKGERPLLKCINSLYFELMHESSAPSSQISEETILTKELLIHFATLTYGSLRGIIIAKGNDENIPLPVIPPLNFYDIITSQ